MARFIDELENYALSGMISLKAHRIEKDEDFKNRFFHFGQLLLRRPLHCVPLGSVALRMAMLLVLRTNR